MKTTKVVLMIPYFAPGNVTLKNVLNCSHNVKKTSKTFQKVQKGQKSSCYHESIQNVRGQDGRHAGGDIQGEVTVSVSQAEVPAEVGEDFEGIRAQDEGGDQRQAERSGAAPDCLIWAHEPRRL